jgi:hypothetical protein
MDINKAKPIWSAGLILLAMLTAALAAAAQKPVPAPSPSPGDGNYVVTSSFELGARGLTVNGDNEKYRSDLNYKPGFRLFDSSVLIEDKTKGYKLFDTALIQSSGFGSDSSGAFRMKMDRTGIFKLDTNIRRNRYTNNLQNFATRWSQTAATANSEHQFNTVRHFGDVDLTVFPESETFRLRFGYSFNNSDGPGYYTMRWPQFSSPTTTTRGDEFAVNSSVKTNAQDFRAGVEGKLLGFNVGLNYGHRIFRDKTRFLIDSFNVGNDPGATSATVTNYERRYGDKGTTDYANFFFQRTFEKKFDLTGRFIYSESISNINEADTASGTSTASGTTAPRILVDLDQLGVTGRVKRPQARGDLGATYRFNDHVSISDTFNFDQFNIGGGNDFLESLVSRTTAGASRPNDLAHTLSDRVEKYRRFTNLIDGDVQVNKWFAFNVGYRFTRRRVIDSAIDRNRINGAITIGAPEEFENNTNSWVFGVKVKPTKNWAVYADAEKGEADNVFTRLANNDFKSFRLRSVASFKKFSFNVSGLIRNNNSPGVNEPILGTGGAILIPSIETVASTRTRYISGSFDWTPTYKWAFSAGYTYNRITSDTDVIVPVGAPILTTTTWFFGKSLYFSKDSFFFFDVTAHPMKRVTFFASYRIDNDPGQGSLRITRPQDIITSYPMRFQTPEARLAIRLTKNIDWNLGYQYYSYRETAIFNPFAFTTVPFTVAQIPVPQNYTAHMPYTSLRFYFGRRSEDGR